MLKDKIKSLRELRGIVARLKRQGKKIVFTNGCFDLLHLGHACYFEAARRLGDVLIVAVNSDDSVRRLKGRTRPITCQKQRLGLIAALKSVDYTLLFNEDTPLNAIKALRPDIIAKGADWKKSDIVGGSFVNSYGGKVSTVRLVKGLSTTNIIKKIKECL